MATVTNTNTAAMHTEQLRRDAEAAFSLGASEDDTWAFISKALNKGSYGGLDTTVKNMIVQQAMQKKAEMANMLTNLLKSLYDSAMAVIRNLRLS